jgi:ATP-dependent exoDNAse (exonuclease V) beta subunit
MPAATRANSLASFALRSTRGNGRRSLPSSSGRSNAYRRRRSPYAGGGTHRRRRHHHYRLVRGRRGAGLAAPAAGSDITAGRSVAVTRAIADAHDTLALGALLRGPLVGLTEAELLDISEGLPADLDHPGRLQHLMLWTKLDHVNHDLARRVLEILQSLAKRARTTTPYMLLSDAVSLLDMRAQLRQRVRASADRAIANVDLFLETVRAYDVRGLRAFARDVRANWEEQVRQVEGRPDAEEQSVSLITIHAAKGLEWPIVIPINMTGTPKSESGLMHDRRSGEFSVPVLGIEPADYAPIKSWNETELARERVRLWYVAATRARDLLVLPRHNAKLSNKSWARIVDLDIAALRGINAADLGAEMSLPTAPAENTQTETMLADEAKRIFGSRDHNSMASAEPA